MLRSVARTNSLKRGRKAIPKERFGAKTIIRTIVVPGGKILKFDISVCGSNPTITLDWQYNQTYS